MHLKKFIINSSNISRDSFLWNMIGSMIMAFQSVILLMILTRTVGLVEAGIFTIAYANANLFLTIGKYGVRNYQVSDVKNEYTFREYCLTRWITIAAMLTISLVYVVYISIMNSYTLEKTMVVGWMCLFKVPDVIDDVYWGEYQRQGRLDIASKAMAFRLATSMLVYALLLVLTKNQLSALIAATAYSFAALLLLLKWTASFFQLESEYTKEHICRILKNCFPLFAGGFLSFYIGNAPKYAIDATLTDELQACYGFIAMPVFVIGLLNGFIFNPMLCKISLLWEEKKMNLFIKQILLQIMYVIIIMLTCLAGAWLLGVPVLSFLYHTDLSPYKSELLILLLGGGFLGMSGLLNAIITIMRRQHELFIGYLLIAVLAFLLSKIVVGKYAMMGAALLYAALMAGLCVCFLLVLLRGLRKDGYCQTE